MCLPLVDFWRCCTVEFAYGNPERSAGQFGSGSSPGSDQQFHFFQSWLDLSPPASLRGLSMHSFSEAKGNREGRDSNVNL